MRKKDISVECKFDPRLTELLFEIDDLYRKWDSELIITSGSELAARHSYTSLHYDGKAADIRTWNQHTHGRGTVPTSVEQFKAIKQVVYVYCEEHRIPYDWIDVVLEKTHIHIELQPKRIES